MPNYFAFFQLPEKFSLDKKALDTAFQNELHNALPNHAEKAVHAYQTLCHPIKRATYLCSINGFSLETITHQAIPADFIFEQIEWRNHIDNARIEKKLESLEFLSTQLQKRMKAQMELIEEKLNAKNFALAIHEIKKMLFLEKLAEEIHFTFDAIDSSGTN